MTRRGDERWLIVGLGNPGQRFARTRHNAGALLLEFVRTAWALPALALRKSADALVTAGPCPPFAARCSLVLSFPQAFMNASGRSVAVLHRRERVPLNHIIIIHDDTDITFGRIKFQHGRSSAGHKGVQSIIDALGSNAFSRLRIGVGPVPPETDTEDFVLSRFPPEALSALTLEIFPTAQQRLEAFLARR